LKNSIFGGRCGKPTHRQKRVSYADPTLFISYLGFSPSPVDLVSPGAFSSFDIYALCLV